MMTLLRSTFVHVVPLALLATGCGPGTGDSGSALMDDPVPSAYAFNEAGLKLFTEGVRTPMAKSLETAKWPLYDKRELIIDLGPLGQIRKDVVTHGESWATDPMNRLELKVEAFKRREGGGFNQWAVRLVGVLPFQGWVKTDIAGGNVVDTTYDTVYRLVVDGELDYREIVDTAAEKLLVDFTAKFTAIHGELVDLKFHSGLLSWDPVKEIVRGKLNEALRQNEPRWLEQANGALAGVMKDERLRTDIDSFYAVFDPEGDPQ